jgi:hypothetical protein
MAKSISGYQGINRKRIRKLEYQVVLLFTLFSLFGYGYE